VNCRETLALLPLFVDGELSARQMRDVALHSTRCPGCERELRSAERLQELVSECVNSAVDDMGTVDIWSAISPRIGVVSQPWAAKIRDWWESSESQWLLRVPVYAVLTALLIVLIARWMPQSHVEQDIARVGVDNSVIFDSVRSDAPSLALLNEPETNTMVLWVTDDATAGAEDLGGTP